MKKPAKKTDRPAFRPLADEQLRQVAGGDVYMHNPRGSNNRLDDTTP